MKFGNIFNNPALKSRITSANVKLPEMAIGYFLAPMCAMLANSIFGAYLSRYYSDVLGWTKFGAFAALLPIVSVVLVVAGNLMIGRWIDNTSTPAGKARPYLLLAIPLLAIAIILMFLTPTGGSNIPTGLMRRLYLGFPMIHFILNFPMEIYILRRSLTGENTEKKTVGLSCL